MSAATTPPRGGPGATWPWAIRKNVYIVQSRLRVLAAVAIVCLGVALIVDFVYPKMYTSTTRLVTQPTVDQASPVEQNTQTLVDSLNYMETQIEVVQSAALLRNVVVQNDLDTRLGDISTPMDAVQGLISPGSGAVSKKQANIARAVDLLGKRVKASEVKDSFVLEIDVSSGDPKLSQQLATSVATQYLQTSQESKLKNLQSSDKVLTGQLKTQNDKVQAATKALTDFDHANDPNNQQVTTVTGSGTPNETQRQQDPPLRAQRATLEWQVESEQNRYEEVEKQLDTVRLQENLAKNKVDASDLLDKPALPTAPDGISTKYRIALYVLLALVLGVGACYGLHYWDQYRRSLPAMISRLA